MFSRLLATACLAMALCGCAAVTISPQGLPKLETAATYSKKQPFFLFGIIGERHIDVTAVCGNRPVLQMQTIDTFSDRLLAGVTIGIYTPRTARIWCGNTEA